MDKLKGEFKRSDSLIENYEISKPKLFNPSIVIFQVDEQFSEGEVLEGFQIQNENLAEATLEARTSYKRKSNTKSSIWGPRNKDKRVNILHDLINQFDLVVINDSDSLPSFNGPCGVSWIDIMMVKNIGVDRIT
ncbi:hypothetical protein AVEN_263948-2 [Araneus ventricosus]|uniref:Endonuclease/exonuclease/phosphatase domain-containing protein n=1 Tax=Araneus ventricosus TaxID=182803 RepID=A0A4Y2HNS9_ARAVE|nr:hypothetical protein AVEN_263948-2 [Araneus ventricosus]